VFRDFAGKTLLAPSALGCGSLPPLLRLELAQAADVALTPQGGVSTMGKQQRRVSAVETLRFFLCHLIPALRRLLRRPYSCMNINDIIYHEEPQSLNCTNSALLAVEHVLGMLAAGDTTDDILQACPWLIREDIQACLVYARRTGNTR
jgi:hypothetical protein